MSNLTLTFLEGRVAFNPPEPSHFSQRQSHPIGSAASLLGKTHSVPLLQAGQQSQRPYLPLRRGEPCRTPSPSISSRCWRSCWPSCCSVTPCWSGRCCSPAGRRTSWCLNESSSSAPAATGWPEATGSTVQLVLHVCSAHRIAVPSSCANSASVLFHYCLITILFSYVKRISIKKNVSTHMHFTHLCGNLADSLCLLDICPCSPKYLKASQQFSWDSHPMRHLKSTAVCRAQQRDGRDATQFKHVQHLK